MLLNCYRALLRHGITLWIDLPLDIVARDVTENQIQFPSFEISTSGSYPEVDLLFKFNHICLQASMSGKSKT